MKVLLKEAKSGLYDRCGGDVSIVSMICMGVLNLF